MQLQSQKPMPGMAMDNTHTTDTTILAKEKLKLKLSHNHGMDMEDMAMEVIMVAGMDADAVKPKLKASHIIFLDSTHTSVDIAILANDLLKPKLTHGEDTVGVDMDMEDIMVKCVYHGSDIYEMITTSSWI